MRLDYIVAFLIIIFLIYLVGRSNAKAHRTSVRQETINWLISYTIFVCMFIVVLGMFYLPATLVHTLYFESCTIAYNKPPDMSISLTANILAILVCLGISWFLAIKSEHMGVINGMGTKLVGQEKSTEGYIATKWLVMVFLPLIPIKSYEVFGEQEGAYERVYYSMRPLPGLAKKQVLITYLKSFLWYLFFAVVVVSFGLIGVGKCF